MSDWPIIVLTFFLVVFTGLTWRVYRQLAQIEGKNQELSFDPDLMVIGWIERTTLIRPEQQGHWSGNLWFCNPGSSPIVIMSWQLNRAANDATVTISGRDTPNAPIQTWQWGRVLIPGGESKLTRVEVTGNDCSELILKYGTASARSKEHRVQLR